MAKQPRSVRCPVCGNPFEVPADPTTDHYACPRCIERFKKSKSALWRVEFLAKRCNPDSLPTYKPAT